MVSKQEQERRSTDVAISLLQNNFSHMQESITELKETMEKHYAKQESQMSELIEAMAKTYSRKDESWAEKVMIYIATAIGGVLIPAFLYLVINK